MNNVQNALLNLRKSLLKKETEKWLEQARPKYGPLVDIVFSSNDESHIMDRFRIKKADYELYMDDRTAGRHSFLCEFDRDNNQKISQDLVKLLKNLLTKNDFDKYPYAVWE